jgi:parallel beta-helix repeat protein
LYVGGSGPGNYTKIQDAINNSQDGDIVFVYSGIYYERIIIRNAICLMGESKNTTILDAINTDDGALISLVSDNITIKGFTFRFKGDWGHPRTIISNLNPHGELVNITISENIFQTNMSSCIWFMGCDFCTITQNIFYLNVNIFNGINLDGCHKCVVTKNQMNSDSTGETGISLHSSSYITISNNSFNSTSNGLHLQSSWEVTISNNSFFDNSNAITIYDFTDDVSILSNHIDNPIRKNSYDKELIGISVLSSCHNTTIKRNLISHCEIGLLLEDSSQTFVSMNTFMKNIVHARFYNTQLPTHWDQNYWGRPRILPKPIIGIKEINHIFPRFIEFDWHPAKEPYDIP